MATQCPKCNSENTDTARFCSNCATPLQPAKDFPAHTETIETPFPQFSPGKSIADRYEIIRELGKGGMGEVYLAEDTSLKRQVAIKILPQAFALDEERLARFEREARLLASLNHPNIATIHGLEKSDEQQFLVMELVEGDTLAERIKKGPLPVDEALEVCRKIAEGLESAHEKGIIHRDLKPSNVKVTPEGNVKILDFGLAKTFHEDPTDTDFSKSPTLTDQMTRPGVILGTAAYMSPEQAKGKSVDKRADIWAFGCILFECLSGKRPFEGNTITETIASILKDDPNWASLPANIPGIVSILLQRCLRKDIKKRLQDIGDARIEIEDALSETPLSVQTVSGRETSRRFVMSWWVNGILLLMIAIIVGIATWLLTRSEVTSRPARFIVMPSLDAPLTSGLGTDIAISPDGKRIVYVASIGTTSQLFMRLINEYDFKPIGGTRDGRMPFFSPNSDWLGYYSDFNQMLMKIPLFGGSAVPLEICSAPSVFSAYWGADNNIYLGSRYGYGIRRVSAGGGEPELITTLDSNNNEMAHDSPVLLPDDNMLLYAVIKEGIPEECLIVVKNLKTGDRKTLINGGTNIQYAQTGHLAYNRNGTLLVAPLNLKQLRVGDWVPVVDDIRAGGSLAAEFSLSREGTLVYVFGMTQYETYPVWINKQGIEIPLDEKKSQYTNVRISPDGKYVAFSIWDKVVRTFNIWIYDIQRGVNEQITFEGNNPSFVWSPDGKRIAYVSEKEGTAGIYLKSLIEDRRTTTLLTSNNDVSLNSWSPDGNWLAFQSIASGNSDIWLYSFKDNKSDPYLNSVSVEMNALFSANGKWMVYNSNEQGSNEIYVRSLASDGGKWKISLDGGFNPRWAVSGDRLFYQSENKIMSVSVNTTPTFQILGQPEPLYESIGIKDYDVHPKDNLLLVVKVSGEFEDRRQIRIVLNWIEELNRLSGHGEE